MFNHELGFFVIELLILLNVSLALLGIVQIGRRMLGGRRPEQASGARFGRLWEALAAPLARASGGAARAEEAQGRRGEGLSQELDAACEALASEYRLSQRERDILPYLMRGYKAASIGNALHISESTVHMHVRRMWEKLGVGSTEDLLALAEGRPCARRRSPEPRAGRPSSAEAKP